MAAINVRLLSTGSLIAATAALRARLLTTEAAVRNYASLRAVLSTTESAVGNFPNMRVRFSGVEDVVGNYPNLRVRALVVEELIEILEERMATEIFPELKGLAFEVHKKPNFSNKIVVHTSGAETATSYWENPKWDYTLTYDYLPDRPVEVGETDLKTMMGFFLARRGRFEAFLFKDPDDYQVVEGFQKTFDGVTLEFNLVRGMGGFYEPVGQLNQDTVLDVWLIENETHTIPVTPGPYTVTTTHSSVELYSVKIGATTLVATGGAPGINEYSVVGDTYTFNSGRQGQDVVFNYKYLVDPADYTVTLPNVITFDSAPPEGAIAIASFQYYFVCRFKDDAADFDKFMNQLWELQELNFGSLIL